MNNFEDNIKNLVIPALNYYLNSNQFDVNFSLSRQKNKPDENLEQSHINSMTKIEVILYSNTSSKWLTTTTTRITALWQYNSSAA